MLAENLQTVRENKEIFIKASKNNGLKENSEKIKYQDIQHMISVPVSNVTM